MKTRTKVLISIIAVVLSIALVTTILLLTYGKSVNQLVRTMEIQRHGLDVKSTLSSYDNPKYNTQGTITYFEGTKRIDISKLSNIDNINIDKNELEKIDDTAITYNYEYDNSTNKVNKK